ncbi:MAG: UbiD family decarboxylase [Deltaproteobacteria bacterium]|nr:UbiD family decarboxylase [Deltaproteobacteria bacterium]
MGFKDNREFIKALDKTGDVVHVKQEVDWELEIGAISRRSCEISGPAVMFENIKDYPGQRVLASPLAIYRRFAIALGMDPETSLKDIYDEYARRMEHPIPPVVVKDGPCKENIIRGDDIDIFRFPAPLIHDGDGGRYAGTWAFEITKDLHSSWVNWAIHRVMIYNRNTVAGLFTQGKHIGMHIAAYLAEKKPVPVAIVVGADPMSTFVSSFFIEARQDEADYAGALNQQPVELVKCETIPLYVPAHAEIIIEGELQPDITVPEGPFGEFSGYRHGIEWQNIVKIKAITHRDDPIFTCANTGMPMHESLTNGLARSFDYMRYFKGLGLPVTGVNIPPEFSCMALVVAVKKTQGNIAMRVKNAIMAWRPIAYHKIFVVDDDVDIFNLNEVLHAFSAKCHPRRGIKVSDDEMVVPLVPSLSEEERKAFTGSVALFDCTWPIDLPKKEILQKIAFSTYPEQLKNKVIKNWSDYGFK